jgi:hypothetical protein
LKGDFAMSQFRTTWFFKLNNYGWTENFHHTSQVVNTVELRCETLAPFRKALLGSNAQLVGVRISDDEVFRDSVFLQNPPFFGPGTYPGTCDPAFSSLLTRWDASAVTRKNLYLRGIPDDLVIAGQFDNDPTWAPRWTAYRQQVVALGFGIRRLLRTANPLIPISLIDTLGKVSSTVPHNFVIGNRVHFTGVKANPKVPTNMFVSAVDNTFNFTVQNWGARGNVFPNAGNVRKFGYEVESIIQGTWERVVKKSTGRPFDTPRGRRRRVA